MSTSKSCVFHDMLRGGEGGEGGERGGDGDGVPASMYSKICSIIFIFHSQKKSAFPRVIP